MTTSFAASFQVGAAHATRGINPRPCSGARRSSTVVPGASRNNSFVKNTNTNNHVCRAKQDDAPEEQELDFVTRMVVKVFGKDALEDPEPMGLKRMTKEEWPDQWPALLDEFAEPLPSDDTPELKNVRAVLKQTQLENQPLGLAFDAGVHGWKASSFHTQLDGQGAAILVATTTDGTVFGGYNPKGWLGYGEWLDAISAFLFVYPKGPLGLGGGGKPIKLGKCGGSGMAIIDEDGKGPKWGPDGLAIDLEERVAKSRLGSYYDAMPNGSKSIFGGISLTGGGGAAQLKELRVYVALGDSELAKNYVPNMFQWQKGELEKIRENDPKPGQVSGEGDSQGGGFKFPWQK